MNAWEIIQKLRTVRGNVPVVDSQGQPVTGIDIGTDGSVRILTTPDRTAQDRKQDEPELLTQS